MGLTRIRAQQITDIDYKQAVRVATTGDVSLAGGAPTVVDGVTLVLDNRILVRAQSNAAQNGIYFVSTLGTGSDGTWTRTNDANQTGEIDPGMVVMVTEGDAYADTPWKLITNGEIVIGVTELTFEQFSDGTAAGANTQIQFNNAGDFAGSANLTWNGTELYVNGAANVTGNISGSYILGNGSQLTGLPEGYGNANVAVYLPTYTGNLVSLTGDVTTTANVTGGNLNTSGAASANTLTVTNTASIGGNLVMNSQNITGVANPVNPQDAATKTYVDEVAEGLKAKPSVYLATTENLTATYDNGTAGVGSTLTATTNEQFPLVDGEQANTTQGFNGVLVKNQTNAAENGRYNLTTLGDAGNAWVLTRCSLCDTATEIPGSYTFVQDGDVNAGTGWVQTVADPATFVVGTDPIIVVQFSGAGTYTAGTGLTLANNVFSISNTAVTSGSYGSGDQVATFAVNAQGQLTAAANTVITANAANLTGTVLNSSVVTSSLTSVGTLGTLSVTGNISGDYFIGNGSQLTGIDSGGISWTTQANTAPASPAPGDFWYDSFTGIKYQYTDDGTGNVWVDQSAPTTFSSISTGQILNSGTSGVGNIGSEAATFNTVFAKATSAQYADLAEKYSADAYYAPGTVVVFGGTKEITQSVHDHDHRIAGVISTNPAFIMNNLSNGLLVALTGRVPCLVQGPVTKGDLVVSSNIPGTAQRLVSWRPGCVIGKSLEDISDNSIKTIEVVIGRF